MSRLPIHPHRDCRLNIFGFLNREELDSVELVCAHWATGLAESRHLLARRKFSSLHIGQVAATLFTTYWLGKSSVVLFFSWTFLLQKLRTPTRCARPLVSSPKTTR